MNQLLSHVKLTKKLLDYQFTSVSMLSRMLEKNNAAILYSPCGTGKTIMSLAASLFNKGRILFVSEGFPKTDIKNKIQLYENEFGFPKDIVDVCTYHFFADIRKLPAKEIKKYGTLIFDECHKFRNWRQMFTQRLFNVKNNSSRKIFLTATPYIKDYWDLMYALRVCGFEKHLTTEQITHKFFHTQKNYFSGYDDRLGLKDPAQFDAKVSLFMVNAKRLGAGKEFPPINYKVKTLNRQALVPKNIKEQTKCHVKNEIQVVKYGIDEIRKFHESKSGPTLVLFAYHESLKLAARRLEAIVADTPAKVGKAFKTERAIVLSTFGLTRSSFDFNQCNKVIAVGSTFSFSLDLQSFLRAVRIEKKDPVDVMYLTLRGNTKLLKSIERFGMTKTEQRKSMLFSPTKFEILDKCPGAYWFYKRGVRSNVIKDTLGFNIAAGAAMGAMQHYVAEQYLKNPDLKLDSGIPKNIVDYVKYCRKLMKKSEVYEVEADLYAKSIHKEFGGVCDFWSFDGKTLTVVDLKTGKSPVSPKNNLQLFLYSIMIISSKIKIMPKKLVHVIFQGTAKPATYINPKPYMVQYKKRSQEIIEDSLQYGDDPTEGLSNSCTSRFCPAYEYHLKNRR